MESDENLGVLISTGSGTNTSSKRRNLQKAPHSESISNDIYEDDELLIRNESNIIVDKETWKYKIKQKKFWFWAEVVFFMYSFCDYPNVFATQKYTLDQITLSNWQYDLDHNITHSFDIFNSSTSGNSCTVNTSSDAFQFMQRNQVMASHFSMIRMSVWIIPAMFSNIIFGSLSDKYGRRWVFIPPLLGTFIWSFLLCIITFYKLNIYYILVIDLLNGLGGAFGCMILATVAYVAGQTTSEKRLLRLTILQLFSLIAASLSPPIFGEVLEYMGAPITLLITSFISGFNLIYCITFLPNFHEPKIPVEPMRRTVVNENNMVDEIEENVDRLIDVYNPVDEEISEKTNPCTIISQQFKKTRELYTRNRIWLLKGKNLLIVKPEDYNPTLPKYNKTYMFPNNAVRLLILMVGFFTVCTPLFDGLVLINLYLMNSPLCWNQSMIGLFTGLSTLMCAVGSVTLTRLLEMWFDHTSIAIICCVVCAIARIYLFFVKNTLMMFIGILFLPFTNIVIPSIRTIMTLLVPESKHGCVLGSLGSVEVFCLYTASMLFSEIYAATLYISTAFVFVISGTILFLSLFIFVMYKVKYKDNQALFFTESMVIRTNSNT